MVYLSLVEGHGPEKAIRMIKEIRGDVVPSWEAYHGCVEDLTEKHRPRVEKRAYRLYRKGARSNAGEDWARAQIDVLGEALRTA